MLEILAIILSVAALIVSLITFIRDHERSRRLEAIKLLMRWSENLNHKASLARKYVEKLDKKQIMCLSNQEEIIFNECDNELYLKIKELLNNKNTENYNAPNEKNTYKLTCGESSELRWIVITYLNMLESILMSWRYNVADDGI